MSKIPWTENLSFPMKVDVAFSANRPNIINMRIRISEMVVVFDGIVTAIETRKQFRFCYQSFCNSIIQFIRNLLLPFLVWRKILSFFPYRNRAASSTDRKQAVPSASIFTKFCMRKPQIALVTPFNPALSPVFVFFDGKPRLFGYLFANSIISLRHISSFENTSNNFCPL